MNKNTLIVNFFAGPGAGKSTIAAKTFAELKNKDIDCELVTEYAKELTWQGRKAELNDQIYLFGKQYHKIFTLLGKVDVIITDAPFLIQLAYIKDNEKLQDLITYEFKQLNNLNYFLNRTKPYNPNGRNQTEFQAQKLDAIILAYLINLNIPYAKINKDDSVLEKILENL